MREGSVDAPKAARPKGPVRNVVAFLGPSEIAGEILRSQELFDELSVDARLGNVTAAGPSGETLKDADIAILEVNPDDDRQLEAFRDIVIAHAPNLQVIATCAEVTSKAARSLIQAGAVDVLPQPITQHDLIVGVERALRAIDQRPERQHSHEGQVISVLKAGGGVGATALAAQMALSMQSQDEAAPVVVLDLDLQFGAVGLYLDLPNRRSVVDIMESGSRLDAALFHSVMYKHTSGLNVLSAPKSIVPLETLKPDSAAALIDMARADFQTVIVDLPAVWTSWSYRILQESDVILLVSEPSVGNIRQASRQLAMMRTQGLTDKAIKVVLNRYKKGLFKQVDVSACEAGLGRKIDHVIPNNYGLMSTALNRGLPLSEVQGASALGKAINQLADAVAQEALRQAV